MFCKHIKGVDNILSDKLTRFQVQSALDLEPRLSRTPAVIPEILQPAKLLQDTKLNNVWH